MYQGSLGNLDPKTGQIKWYPLAAEYNDNRVQLNFVGLRHDVDGKVWTKSVGTQDIYRLDLATDKWERFQPLKELASRPASIYQVISDFEEQPVDGRVPARPYRQDRRQDRPRSRGTICRPPMRGHDAW